MIRNISPIPSPNIHGIKEWCEVCKRKCDTEERTPYIITSNIFGIPSKIVCKCCIDDALYKANMIPEKF